ncbi:Solute carrier family 40 member 3, chloroplastic [Zostera marina]|uniref:Solute carrier family 40 member n=1 Tax=Zostera marina TaxID=29655 RepID=A0A0K9PD56_ZOSMR|nr:Solute carrier family 40 member 3, chloroplastic [Zostera marina]
MGFFIVTKALNYSSHSLFISSSVPTAVLRSFPERRHLEQVLWPLLSSCPSQSCRITSTTSKCFAANIDVEVVIDEGAKKNEDPEDLVSIHLTSDILGTESLNLLEANYVNSSITALPVSSDVEQNILESTPLHPAALYALYTSNLIGNLGEQMWNFAWPLSLALIHPSLLPVTVASFFSKLTIFIGAPMLGNLIDCFPRIPAYNFLSLIQTVTQLLSSAMIIYGLTGVRQTSASAVLLQPWFVLLVFSTAIERLSGLAFGVMVERDWVVLLAGSEREIALAQANATLSRVDMFCEIAGASLFGFLLSKYDHVTCLKFAASLMACSLPIMILLGQIINKLSDGTLGHHKLYHGLDEFRKNVLTLKSGFVDAFKTGFIEYKNQPVLPASLAYVMLFFNIVLAPGAMMTTFLTHQSISPAIIGGFSGLCAFMGVSATFISASLVKRLGVLKAGAAGLIFQSSLLIIAVVVLWGSSLSKKTPLFFFLFLIVMSRLGNMVYDVIGTQILQTGIPPSKANLIGTTELSIASLAEFLMLGVAIIANDVSNFRLLAILSLFSVVGATTLFCRWLTNPTSEQRKLFPNIPSSNQTFDLSIQLASLSAE